MVVSIVIAVSVFFRLLNIAALMHASKTEIFFHKMGSCGHKILALLSLKSCGRPVLCPNVSDILASHLTLQIHTSQPLFPMSHVPFCSDAN